MIEEEEDQYTPDEEGEAEIIEKKEDDNED